MTTLGIRYLTGRSVSTDIAQAEQAEWPPHPARVFMAMAAAHFETHGDEREKDALLWLENQPSPKLIASEAAHRSDFEVYVPVNDQKGALAGRSRQPRRFPSVKPESEFVYMIWPSDAPPTVLEALDRLCGKVTRVGHSSSLVQMFVESNLPEGKAWIPDDRGPERIRVPEAGFLHWLVDDYNGNARQTYEDLKGQIESASGKKKKQLENSLKEQFGNVPPNYRRPESSNWKGYRRPGDTLTKALPSPFSPNLIVLEKEGTNLGLESTIQLTGALRRALLEPFGKDAPEWLSGHQPDGSPTRKPHVALFPLPYVGTEHADGHVLGLAIALPRTVSPAKAAPYIGPLLFDAKGGTRKFELTGRGWFWTVSRADSSNQPVTLQLWTWTTPSRVWSTVTPIVLHHYPDKHDRDDVERIVREAFASALLPPPVTVCIQSASAYRGAGHSRNMPPFTEGGNRLCRYHVHATVAFDQDVEGPLLVGRGRFRGYGLLRPAPERKPRT